MGLGRSERLERDIERDRKARRELTLERARKWIGKGTYVLGGGRDGDVGHKSPLDANGGCDCSMFECWCLELSKDVRPCPAWLKAVNGGWYNTDGIYWDAEAEPTGIFISTDTPVPGDVIVYPALWCAHAVGVELKSGPRIGHVGIVSEVYPTGRPSKVIHCSAGNQRRFGYAIAETDTDVFDRVPYTVCAVYEG